MAEFKILGKTIQITVDGPKIRAVRSSHKYTAIVDKKEVEVPLDLAAKDGSQFTALGDDPLLAEDVLWTLCHKSAQAAGIDESAFRSALTGDEGGAAVAALREAVIDFFPSRHKAILEELAAKVDASEAKIYAAALAKVSDPNLFDAMLDKSLAAMDAEIEAALSGTTRRKSVTDLPGS